MTREHAMEDHIGPIFSLVGAFITAACTVIVATITGFWSWLSGRKKGAADFQVAVQNGFSGLVDQLQEELVRLRKVILEQNHLIEEQKSIIAAQAADMTQMKGQMRDMTQAFQSLQRLLEQNGITIPPELQRF